MKTNSLSLLIFCGLLLLAAPSCDDKANDWPVDPTHDRLFRSTDFTSSSLQATSILIQYFGVTDATSYLFEFSEGDSLQFNNITRTVEILADTLTPYAEASTAVETEYRTLFSDLKGTTPYSVRMKALSSTRHSESGYSMLYFLTPNEQIITGSHPSLGGVTFTWIPGLPVTHIICKAPDEQLRFELSPAEKADGRATLSGLSPGITYNAELFNDDAIRGRATFIPLGLPETEGFTRRVTPDEAPSLSTILTDLVAEGKTTVALVFNSNQVYEIDRLTLPAGLDNLHLIGDVPYGNTSPELYLNRIALSAPIQAITAQKIDLNARLNSSNYVFDLGTANGFKTIDFDDCTIRNIGRSMIRPNNTALDIDAIRFNNCLIQNVGISGYGFVNMGVDAANLTLLSITNSTITEIGSDRLFHLKGGVKQVTLDKVTLLNYTSKSAQIFRFDTAPAAITVTNSIFGGTNGGNKINAGNSNYAYLEFYGCFITADLLVNTIPFTNITTLPLTSEDLFADPLNGDFHLKPGARFAGEGKAGDPRWW
jgi:hypothetical protein